MKVKKTQTVILGVIFLIGALALIEEFLFIAMHPGDAVLRYPFWLSCFAYASSVVLGIANLRSHRVFLLGASLACGLTFLLSLRSIELNPEVAEVREYYAGMEVRSLELERFNDDPYCVSTSNFRFEINNGKGLSKFVALRGVWPVYFGDAAIEQALLPLRRCVS